MISEMNMLEIQKRFTLWFLQVFWSWRRFESSLKTIFSFIRCQNNQSVYEEKIRASYQDDIKCLFSRSTEICRSFWRLCLMRDIRRGESVKQRAVQWRSALMLMWMCCFTVCTCDALMYLHQVLCLSSRALTHIWPNTSSWIWYVN